jgi:hypothetical protein
VVDVRGKGGFLVNPVDNNMSCSFYLRDDFDDGGRHAELLGESRGDTEHGG